MVFKIFTTSGWSVQIALNLVCRKSSPVAIDVLYFVKLYLSVMEKQLCKVNAHFLLDPHNYCMQPAFRSHIPQ